jgi:hypothetical protein
MDKECETLRGTQRQGGMKLGLIVNIAAFNLSLRRATKHIQVRLIPNIPGGRLNREHVHSYFRDDR